MFSTCRECLKVTEIHVAYEFLQLSLQIMYRCIQIKLGY